jgi:hypothetical protein
MSDRKSTTRTKRAEHTRGMARMFAFFSVLGVMCALTSVRFARAEVLDQSLVIGRQMTELARSSKNEISHVVLNGQSLMFANQLSKDSPEQVLQRYEKLCRDEAAQHDDAPALLRADTQDRNEGSVMCFLKSGASKPTLKEALDAFARTGDMGALGQLRYAYVKKTAQGNTSVLAAWTREKFDLKEMMPEDGDAPGQDFAELRAPRARGGSSRCASKASRTGSTSTSRRAKALRRPTWRSATTAR